MTRSVSPDPDPRSQFVRDQEAAATEIATRDETAWLHHVQDHDDIHAMRQADTARMQAMARLIGALASLIALAVFAGAGALVVLAVQAIR